MEEQADITLLPCPFCGGEASFGYRPHPTLPDRNFLAVCEDCNAMVNYKQSKQEAAEVWNRRTK